MPLIDERAVEILGVKPSRKGAARPTLRLVVEAGLAASAFDLLVDYANLTRNELAQAANIPLRTVQRRQASRAHTFERAESDRLARIARLYAIAEDVLGSQEAAQRWMTTPNRALDGAQPLRELETDIAAREVEDLLGRIRFGVFG